MKLRIRPHTGPQTPGGESLGEQVPELVARLRGPELDYIASLIISESPASLVSLGRTFIDTQRQSTKERSALINAFGRTKSAREHDRIIEHHLRSTSRGWDLQKDLAATRRDLDMHALLEREDKRIESAGVHIELVAHLLNNRSLEPATLRFLELLLDETRLATRRVAAHAITSAMMLRSATGEDDTTRAERLLAHATHSRQDPITARRLAPLIHLIGDRAAPIIKKFCNPSNEGGRTRDSFIVRARLLEVLISGGPLENLAWRLGRNDRSAAVRCSLASGLSTNGSPDALERLKLLADQDAAKSVRSMATHELTKHADVDQEPEMESLRISEDIVDLADALSQLKSGQSIEVPIPDGSNPVEVAVALVPHAKSSHGFSIAPSTGGHLKITRGERKTLRLWRALHEIRHARSDKRYLGDHLTGTTLDGPIRVPSTALAEVCNSGTIGQRQHSELLGGWAPWLPTVQDLIDATNWGALVIVTEEGVTTVGHQIGGSARLAASFKLSNAFAELDALRNKAINSELAKDRIAYLNHARSHGLTANFSYSNARSSSEKIEEFFDGTKSAAVIPLAALPLQSGGATNNPRELAVVAGLMGAGMMMRMYRNRRNIDATRSQIPLVIGGWGTRGKSGTARLKAALFEGLSIPYFCKTTGSDATCLHAPSRGRGTELKLFRPYDKVSIWEHARAMSDAKELGARVFIWECMGLRPEYVDQLQHVWTNDDLSTITNAHSDHEDLQGPTGLDVAKVIAGFIPKNSLAITTEREMAPILRDRASSVNTPLIEVPARYTDSIPEDLLSRLPYEEHPSNVALVMTLAEQLGMDSTEALVLMADNVTPDLGSLKTTPPMRHLGRLLLFTNGMAANQTTGLLSNWQRSGFDQHNPMERPDQFMVTIINNRADRVSRSKAFAHEIMHNLNAHRHFIVGENPLTFVRFVQDALEESLAELSLPRDKGSYERKLREVRERLSIVSPRDLLLATYERLGISKQRSIEIADTIAADIAQAPEGVTDLKSAQEIARHHLEPLRELSTGLRGDLFHDSEDRLSAIASAVNGWESVISEALLFASMSRRCSVMEHGEKRDTILRQVVREIVMSHIVVVNGHPSTDHVIETIARSTPIGVQVNIMGIQNIRGPGRELSTKMTAATDAISLTAGLNDLEYNDKIEAFKQLERITDWSIPACQEVLRRIYLLTVPSQIDEKQIVIRDLRDDTVKRLNSELARLRNQLVGKRGLYHRLASLFDFAISLFRPIAMIVWRMKADQTMRDLKNGRISHSKAESKLKGLSHKAKSRGGSSSTSESLI